MLPRVLVLFALGATVGSLVGAVVWRSSHSLGFVTERSMCERCGHRLAAIDLVPVVSWLLLRGRCRYCRERIAVRHVAAEVGTGLAFALSYVWLFG